MSIYGQILFLTTLTGVGGLALGAAAAALMREPSDRQMSLLLRFTAGIMLAVVCFDLIADARESMGTPAVIVWIAVGYAATSLLNAWLHKHSPHSHDHSDPHHAHHHGDSCSGLHSAGIVLAGAVALHNMPVGMAIGATFAGTEHAGAGALAALTIGLHNLPEGMSIAAPLLSGGTKPTRAVAIAALSGVPTILGALLGYSVGAMDSTLLALAMGFAAGAMLCVILGELLSESDALWRHPLAGSATLAGLLLGLALIGEHVH